MWDIYIYSRREHAFKTLKAHLQPGKPSQRHQKRTGTGRCGPVHLCPARCRGPPIPGLAVGRWSPGVLAVRLFGKSWHLPRYFCVLDPSFGFVMLMSETWTNVPYNHLKHIAPSSLSFHCYSSDPLACGASILYSSWEVHLPPWLNKTSS